MGCNTSKDSVPQAESESKENQEVGGETTEAKNAESTNEADQANEADTKSVSAKTITLRSNGTAKSVEEVEQVREKSKTPDVKDITAQNKEDTKDQSDDGKELHDEEQAATKIQAAFRGHKTRLSMKQPTSASNQAAKQPEPEPTREQLEQEFRLDDRELCNAATKIQASFRGHMTRKTEEAKKQECSSSKDEKKESSAAEEELDIDLSDPDLNKAAVKIQASFRGHLARKDNEEDQTAAN